MAQVLFGSDTTPSLVDLDANFTELYDLRGMFQTSAYAVASPKINISVFSVAGQHLRFEGGSTNPAVGFIDGARTANNRTVEFNYNSNIFYGRYLNDAYTSAISWMEVTGGQALGVTAVGFGGTVNPLADNTQSCGTAALRWSVVYAGTGAINTSDAREKTDVEPFTEAEVSAAKALAREIGTFRFLAALAAKGEAARVHVGMTVQRVMDVMLSHGLDPLRYGFICYDEWAEEVVRHAAFTRPRDTGLKDSRGAALYEDEVVTPARETSRAAGSRWGFRTDQLLLFIARGFEARLAALEAAA